MPTLDVKGFNQFQDELLVIDVNLNDEIDAQDEVIALSIPGFRRGEKVPLDHPRFLELQERYRAFVKK